MTVTGTTQPGFSCLAVLQPDSGPQVISNSALAGANGRVVLVLDLPASISPGNGTLTLTCSDPLKSDKCCKFGAATDIYRDRAGEQCHYRFRLGKRGPGWSFNGD